MSLLAGVTSHLGESLSNGLAVNGALGVPAGTGNLGLGGLSQVGSEVVFGLGLSGVDGAALSEKVGNQLFLNRSLLKRQKSGFNFRTTQLFWSRARLRVGKL